MTRYTADPKLRDFQAKIKAEVDRVGRLAKGRGHVIYAIHDPTLRDHRGLFAFGPPIYVGETKQIQIRANDHMKDGGGGSTQQGIKAGRLRTVLEKWAVPHFEIIDEAPSRLSALIAETLWARRYNWLGYELANQWSEHQSKERPSGLQSVPNDRLWDFTVSEALEDGVTVHLRCETCGIDEPVPLESRPPTARLNTLLALKLKCNECGAWLLHVSPPNEAEWKWASYAPRQMPKPE